MNGRRSLALGIVGVLALASAACNALTDVGKYDIVDCPFAGHGACADGGGAGGATDGSTTQDGAATADGSGSNSAQDAASDAADGAPPACPNGTGSVTVTVIPGKNAVDITSNPQGLDVPAGSTGTACLPVGQVELRPASGDIEVLWSGTVVCQGDTQNGRCSFVLDAAGAILSANE